ncbi:MAG: restriction endonuclease [Candidatus Zixiibacteriota bacterium]
MRLDVFQDSLQALSPMDFEKFVGDVIRGSGRFKDVRIHGGPIDQGIDIEAIEIDPMLGKPRRWIFQVKKTRVAGVDVAGYMYAILRIVESQEPTQVVLVVAGSVTQRAKGILERMGVEAWDSAKLAELATPELLKDWFGIESNTLAVDDSAKQKVKAFKASILATTAGKGFWSAYQRLIADLLEFLFCPPLELPRYELLDADKRNRRDILFANSTSKGFWAQIRNDYLAHYIVVDAKNYSKPVTKNAVLDIAHYLKPYGCGMFALLVSRRAPGNAASHATREQWIGANKMIVHINDDILIEMLEVRENGGEPNEVIRRQIDDFRMSL